MRHPERGIIEVIQDAQRQAAGMNDDTGHRRRNPRPASTGFRGVIETIEAGQQQLREAVTLSGGNGRQGADDTFNRQAEAAQWRANLRAMRQDAGPQGRTACGVRDDLGSCINRTHTLTCAASMASTASKATFAPTGSREADRLWAADAAERRRMHELVGGPDAAEETARAEAKAREAEAKRERTAARGRNGAAWVETGRGGWAGPGR